MGSNVSIQADLDQEWEEAREWFDDSDFTTENVFKFMGMLVLDSEEFRAKASAEMIDHVQRLARIAFLEVWKRSHELKESQ